jgi:Arc/MetJ family transcription regulator
LRCIYVYAGVMSRTNIDIDDELLAKAMKRFRLRTKREAVNLALWKLLGEPMTKEEVLAMEGMGYDTDLDELRPDVPDWLREGF